MSKKKKSRSKDSVVLWHEFEPSARQWDAFLASRVTEYLEEKVHD